MPLYRPAQQYSINTLASHVREALMVNGEQIITLHTYSAVDDQDTVQRCWCFDDVYQQTERFICSDCYGTTFKGGVKGVYRSWAVFEDNVDQEVQGRRGQWNPSEKMVQMESYPTMLQNDFLARVIEWDRGNRPARLGDIYTIGEVKEESVRTGTRYYSDSFSEIDNTGQNYKVPPYDRVGQTASATLLTRQHPIYNYPLLGVTINRYDSLQRG